MDDSAPGVESGTPAPWTDGFSEDQLGLVQTKGWAGPLDVLTSYQHAERHIGRDPATLLAIPGVDASDEDLGRVYGALGRPESAEGYTLAELAGAEAETDAGLRALAFELGLNDRQFAQLRARSYERNEATTAARSETVKTGVAEARATLRGEWGDAYGQRDQLAERAAAYVGLDRKAAIKAGLLSGAAGVRLMNGLAQLGEQLPEDVVGGEGGGFAKTALSAKSEITHLKADQAFLDDYLDKERPGHPAAVERMRRLTEAAFPETAR